MSTIIKLPAGHTLTATVGEGDGHIRMVEDSTIGQVVTSTASFGPYMVDRSFSYSGDLTVTTAVSTFVLSSVLSYGAGAPEDAVQATKDVNPTGAENGLTFTAKAYGTAGNSITITYTDPSANDASLSVSVFRKDIIVSLATGSAGAITSTAAEVKAAVEAYAAAARLVTVSILASDTGSADDGSGVVTAMAKAALTGGAGTGIGVAVTGAQYIDTTNASTYENIGTQAVPAWLCRAHLHWYTSGIPVDYTDGSPPATGEGLAYKGALCSDITNGLVYRNSGTRAEPAWTALADVP